MLNSKKMEFYIKTLMVCRAKSCNTMSDWQTTMMAGVGGMQVSQAELATLRQANTEMREKINQLQSSLQERENELKRMQISHVSLQFCAFLRNQSTYICHIY